MKGRLLSLDILRGITIAGMILVNNPGSWSYVYPPLLHAQWNGLTPTDLIFPFFMFIMGISTYISLNKFNFDYKETLYKIIKRTVIIFLIGLALAWFALFIQTFVFLKELPFGKRILQSINNFGKLRILGVLQRLALAYGAAALIAIVIKHRFIPYLISFILITYFFILYFGNGFEPSENNIIAVIDQAILGRDHMYKDGTLNGIALDPEGLVSTLPSIAHVMIGLCCGKILITTKDNIQKVMKLSLIGISLTFIGFLFAYICPINKKIWSPTFVIVTCGLASSFLALLAWIIDIRGKKNWSQFFEVFGVNPLFIYTAAGVLAILLIFIPIKGAGSIHEFIYTNFFQAYFGNYFGSFLSALVFVCINWFIGYILYKKKIFIKI